MMKDDWNSCMKIPWEHKIIVKYAKKARALTLFGYLLTLNTNLTFSLMSLFGLSFRTINNKTDPYEGSFLPLQTYYPFDYEKSPIFQLVYVTQFVAISVAGFSFVVTDFLFGALVFHACARCKILQKKAKALTKIEIPTKLEFSNFATKLKDMVDSHEQVIR